MAIPPTVETFAEPLDPHEELDFRVELGDMLEADETIDAANWSLEVLPEGAALGLTIMSGNGRDATLSEDDRAVSFWLSIDSGFRDHEAFAGLGTELPLRFTAQTSSAPARRRQRTFQVRVAQK
ncbi:MAG: hypothetical protein R3E09_10280 [Novosphingobium sp.]|nr:hypothetical protein [Novosphingobium sp.]